MLDEIGVNDQRSAYGAGGLSPATLRTFLNIMARWNVRDEDTRELLGGLSEDSFSEMKRNPNQVLDIDGLTNISHVVGIFKALKTIYSDELADRWVQLPNSNPIFDGQSPLAYMIKGGRQKMQTVRRLLDARVEGV